MPPAVSFIPRAVFGAPVDHVPADQDDTADLAELRALAGRLYEGLLLLEHDQRMVLAFRFGLAHLPVRTLTELADDMGISPSQVLRIQRRAIASLRAWM